MTVARPTSLEIAVAAVVAGAAMAMAHHSFTMFDQTKQVTITGTVTEFQWTNPHAYIEIDVADENGAVNNVKNVRHWSVELGSPSILMQGGWKFKDLKYGDKVTVVVNPLKSGQSGALLSRITMPDGRVLGNGPIPGGQP